MVITSIFCSQYFFCNFIFGMYIVILRFGMLLNILILVADVFSLHFSLANIWVFGYFIVVVLILDNFFREYQLNQQFQCLPKYMLLVLNKNFPNQMSRYPDNQRNNNGRNTLPTIQLLFQHLNCLNQISYQIQYQYGSSYQSSNQQQEDYGSSSHFTYQYSSNEHYSQVYHQQFSNSEAEEQYTEQIEAVEANNLTIEEIDRIPLMTWTNLNKKYNYEQKCSVCIQNFKEQEKIKVLACLHRFHLECLSTWLHTKKNCPTCITIVEMKDFD